MHAIKFWLLLTALFITGSLPAFADAPDNNLTVESASFLGGSSDDALTAVAIGPDKTVIIAGNIPNENFGLTPVEINGGGTGVVIRLDETGQTIRSVTRFANPITDMDINRSNGTISVIGRFGVVTLDADADTMLWSDTPGNNDTMRVAVAQDGTVAALVASASSSNPTRNVTVYNSSGTEIGNFQISILATGGGQVADLAIDSTSASVFVTGFRQATLTLALPILRAYAYNSDTPKWEVYNYTLSDVIANGDNADTFGQRVAMGRDGQLYFAGSTNDANTVFERDPQDITTDANNINIDDFTNLSNTDTDRLGYFSRFDPATGAHDSGQYAIARLDDYRGNSFGINAITADEDGNIYLGGESEARLPCREADNISDSRLCPLGEPLQINGTPVGHYTFNEGGIISLSSDLTTRRLVAVWAGDDTVTASAIQGVDAWQGVRAMVSTSTDGGNLITVNPVQSTRSSGDDGFFSLWTDPTFTSTITTTELFLPEILRDS